MGVRPSSAWYAKHRGSARHERSRSLHQTAGFALPKGVKSVLRTNVARDAGLPMCSRLGQGLPNQDPCSGGVGELKDAVGVGFSSTAHVQCLKSVAAIGRKTGPRQQADTKPGGFRCRLVVRFRPRSDCFMAQMVAAVPGSRKRTCAGFCRPSLGHSTVARPLHGVRGVGHSGDGCAGQRPRPSQRVAPAARRLCYRMVMRMTPNPLLCSKGPSSSLSGN